MSKPHVLMLPSWYPTQIAPLSGIFFKEQIRALHKAGVRVGVAYPDFRSLRTLGPRTAYRNRFQISIEEEERIPTLRFHGWNIPRLRIGPCLRIRSTLRLIDLYVERFGKPDLFHAHGTLWGGAAAMQAAQRYGIPYFVTEHSSAYAQGLIQPWQEPYICEVIDRASLVLAVSSSLKQCLERYAFRKDIRVVPNMVDTEFFSLPPKPRSASPFCFLTVAFLTPVKGIDLLIRAFAQVFSTQPEVCLELGGNGPQRKELEALAATLGVADRIRFLGLLSRAQVREAMWRANIFVLPSYVETFGVVLTEAMATGLPVVATRSGGPEDLLNAEVGWLTKPGSVSALANALRCAFDLQETLGEKGVRQDIVDRCSEEAVTEVLLSLYKGVVRGGRHH